MVVDETREAAAAGGGRDQGVHAVLTMDASAAPSACPGTPAPDATMLPLFLMFLE